MQSGVKSVDEAHNLIDESKDILARTLDAKVLTVSSLRGIYRLIWYIDSINLRSLTLTYLDPLLPIGKPNSSKIWPALTFESLIQLLASQNLYPKLLIS